LFASSPKAYAAGNGGTSPGSIPSSAGNVAAAGAVDSASRLRLWQELGLFQAAAADDELPREHPAFFDADRLRGDIAV
jgi:hypothetical protein